MSLRLYLPALDCFHQMVGQQNRSSRLRWDAREVFTCMAAWLSLLKPISFALKWA